MEKRAPDIDRWPPAEIVSDGLILRVAVDAPLHRCFDYLPPTGWHGSVPPPGVRIRVPFGRSRTVGVLVGTADRTDVPAGRLRRADAVLDDAPVLDADLMDLLAWAADYYRHPPGAVFAAALPALLRQGRTARRDQTCWQLTAAGAAVDADTVARRAPRQAAVLARLAAAGGPVDTATMETVDFDWRRAMRGLVDKGLAERIVRPREASGADPVCANAGPTLSPAQAAAVEAVTASDDRYTGFLLHGVTGSGKTEVYLRLIAGCLARGRQALVLVPEIGLTPQLVRRFRDRLPVPMAVLHSGLSAGERLDAWCRARDGEARVVIGTRSAVFTPLPQPGLIVVDEEHDASFKQQDGFRYSARDLAVLRGRRAGAPVVLGTATPSLESLNNARSGRYTLLELPERAGAARPPSVHVIDLRTQASRDGVSTTLVEAMHRHLGAGGQVLVFLNRRGYAPAWFCAGCGRVAGCDRCDARLVYHRYASAGRLKCHHCGHQRPAEAQCPDCDSELMPVGQGTERIEQVLTDQFGRYPVTRIDRDSTRRKGSLEALLDEVRRDEPRILVGTQMLTKGHHFPRVTLVAVLNADQGLFGTEFRSNERLAQLIVQVAGRAGRAERPGEVFIQTAYPEHPLLMKLITDGYGGFAEAALEERREAHWPPFTSLAVLRASALEEKAPMTFLDNARRAGERLADSAVTLLGPAPAPMSRRAGRYRAQLLVQSPHRSGLQRFLAAWHPELAGLPGVRKVRWSIDVDPADLF